MLGGLGTQLRREFFPEVDAGAFEIYVRAASGTRIEVTEKRIAQVEKFDPRDDRAKIWSMIISEIGVTPDWSAAYTPNAGPMDAVVKVQLEREHATFGPGICRAVCARLRGDPAFRGPGIRLRRGRHDPRGHERRASRRRSTSASRQEPG